MRKKTRTTLLVLATAMSCMFSISIRQSDATSAVYIRPDGSVDPATAPILRDYSSDSYILLENLTVFADGITIERDNALLDGSGYTIHGSGSGNAVLLSGRNNVTIRRVVTSNFDYGLRLDNCSRCTVSSSVMNQNNYNGIWLYSSSYNNVTSNNVTECEYYGIGLDNSGNNTLSYNLILNNEGGLYLDWSSNNTLVGNSITGNAGNGLRVQLASFNTLRENVIVGSIYNFEVFGDKISYLLHDIDPSNLVNGRPVYYWVGESNKTVPVNAGFVALVGCTNVTVENLNLTNNGKGVIIAGSTNVTIADNDIANNVWGISAIESSDLSIIGNDFAHNSFYGIELGHCLRSRVEDNVVTGSLYVGVKLDDTNLSCVDANIVTDNHRGIEVSSGAQNVISKNRVSSNGENGIRLANLVNSSIFWNNISANAVGIELYYSMYNLIYNNNFFGNSKQVNLLAQSSVNSWAATYPLGGNHWQASLKTDFKSGVDQTEAGSDGLADLPYTIEGNVSDRYPLAGLFYFFDANESIEIGLISNSSVLTLDYFGINGTVAIRAQNSTDNRFGFVRICIPHVLVNFSSVTILVDGSEDKVIYIDTRLYDNETHRWIFFSYEEPAVEMLIIPEVSALAVTMVAGVAGLLLFVNRRKRARSLQ